MSRRWRRSPNLRSTTWVCLELLWITTLGILCVSFLLSLGGCSVNVIVAPDATLSVGSDLSQNALKELEREYE